MRTRHAQKGQALVIGLFALLPIALLMCMIFDVALITRHKRSLQNAADRAAAAGALVQADIISSMAWINLALADLHTQATLHAINVAIAGTNAELASDGQTAGAPVPPVLVGGSNAIGRYTQIYDVADNEISRAEAWEDRLSAMQSNMAALAQQLIRREVYRSAFVNLGVEGDESTDGRVHVNMFPHHASYVPRGEGSESWLISMLTGGGWSMQSSGGTFVSVDIDGNHYVVSVQDGEGNFTEYDINFIEPGKVTINGLGLEWDEEETGWHLYDYGDTFVGQGDNGGIYIESDGQGIEVMRDPNTGGLMQWTDTGWEPVGDSYTLPSGVEIPASTGTIMVGQPPIPINMTNNGAISFNLGGLNVTLNPTGTNIAINGPLSGLTHVTFTYPGQFILNSRWRVPQDASGQWELFDQKRERLSIEGPSQFVFDVATQGDYVQLDNNFNRFGIDQSQELFGPEFGNTEGSWAPWIYDSRDPDTPGWYNPGLGSLAMPGEPNHANHYHRTATCWHALDAICPFHGSSCTGPLPNEPGYRPVDPSITDIGGIDGGWHEQDLGSPTGARWVTCKLCNNFDWLGNGQSDVRRWPQSNTALQDARPEPCEHGLTPVRNSSLRQIDDPTNWDLSVPRRLVLKEDFFRWGINVAVHNNEDPRDLFLLPNFFTDTRFSPIATASAKVGFVDEETGVIRYRFDTPYDAEDWIEEHPQNLTVTDWVAVMVSTRDAFRADDLEITESFSTQENVDSPGVTLLRHYLQRGTGQWRHRYDASNASGSVSSAQQGRDRFGQSWDLDDPNLEMWIKH